MTPDEIRKRLTEHGRRRAHARRQARAASLAIQDLLPEALEAGLSKSEIARLAQITRPALDTMLKS